MKCPITTHLRQKKVQKMAFLCKLECKIASKGMFPSCTESRITVGARDNSNSWASRWLLLRLWQTCLRSVGPLLTSNESKGGGKKYDEMCSPHKQFISNKLSFKAVITSKVGGLEIYTPAKMGLILPQVKLNTSVWLSELGLWIETPSHPTKLARSWWSYYSCVKWSFECIQFCNSSHIYCADAELQKSRLRSKANCFKMWPELKGVTCNEAITKPQCNNTHCTKPLKTTHPFGSIPSSSPYTWAYWLTQWLHLNI